MTERDFYPDVQKWMRATMKESCVVELKLEKGNRFNLNDLKPHQVANLESAHNRSLSYKIPDVGFDQKPFDIFFVTKVPAYVGVIFYIPRKVRHLYMIPIEEYLRLRDQGVVSLDQSECQSVASFSLPLVQGRHQG